MKKRIPILIAVIALVAAGGIAAGSMHGDDVIYTGCLTRGGNIIKVAIGEEPAQPCADDHTLIKWNAQGPSGPPGPSGVSEAFATNNGDVHFTATGNEVDVMALDLPAGNFVSNVTIQVSYLGEGSIVCRYDAITPAGRFELGGYRFGGPAMSETHAHTFDFWLDENTQVVVTCTPWFMEDPPVGDILINSAFWTVIKVDTVTYQPPLGNN